MKRIQTINTRDLNKSAVTGGCGECQTSCQSACKTSCGVANQKCENKTKYGLMKENAAHPGGVFYAGDIIWFTSIN